MEEIERKNIDAPNQRRTTSRLRALNPFMDQEGLVRVGSRLIKADIDDSAKFPYILPRKDQNVRACICHIHTQNLHTGPKATLSDLRQSVWIIHGMVEVRSVISRCTVCQRAFKEPMDQRMAPLPEMRVTPSAPFKEIGL